MIIINILAKASILNMNIKKVKVINKKEKRERKKIKKGNIKIKIMNLIIIRVNKNNIWVNKKFNIKQMNNTMSNPILVPI